MPVLGVAPLADSGTDMEDELPTPDGSPSTDASMPVLGPTSPGVDLQLARALLELGVLPAMVTPIVDPVVGTSATPALYPVPPIPVLSAVDSAPVLVASPLRQVGGAQFEISPCRARYRLLAPCLNRSRPRSRRHYGQKMLPDRRLVWLRWTSSCHGVFVVSGGVHGFPSPAPPPPPPPTPSRIIEELVSGSVVSSPTGEPTVAVAQPSMPDLSREGPFDVHQDYSTSGASPRVLDSMWGCQYRMTSYDEGEWRSGCCAFTFRYSYICVFGSCFGLFSLVCVVVT